MLFPQTGHLPGSPYPILAKNTIFHLWHSPKTQESPSTLPSLSISNMLPNLSILLYTYFLKNISIVAILPYSLSAAVVSNLISSPTFPSPRDSLNCIARAIVLQGESEHVPPLLRACQWLLLALRKGWSPFWGLQGIGHPPRLPVILLFPILFSGCLTISCTPLHQDFCTLLVLLSEICTHFSYLSVMAISEGGLLWIPLLLPQTW